MRTFEEILQDDYHITLGNSRFDESIRLAVQTFLIENGGTLESFITVDTDPSFEDFWTIYDKKTDSKDKCRKKWNKLPKKAREKIIVHVPLYVMSTPNKQYRKNPMTYLNNEGWEHEIINEHGQQTTANQFLRANDPNYKNY